MVSSRAKAAEMREKEQVKQHRTRLREMLLQKLNSKYGTTGDRRNVIAGAVDLVLEKAIISESDLETLETGIADQFRREDREAAKKVLTTRHESPTAADTKKKKPDSSSEGGKERFLPFLAKTSEWRLLDAYQAIENEKHVKCELQKGKQRKQEFKKSLDQQVEAKHLAKSSSEAAIVPDRTYAQRQAKLLAEWRVEAAKKKERESRKYKDEQKVREAQIAERKLRIEKEKASALQREKDDLELCRKATDRDRALALQRKQQERERLKKIQAETRRDRELRDLRKKKEGIEDKELMEAYKAKLEREEEARQNAFAQRMARLEQFAIKSGTETTGAGYQEAQNIRKMEQRILEEAKLKEQADEEREQRDKQNIRTKQRQIALENSRLLESKQRQLKAEHDLEKEYADRYVQESQDYLRNERDKLIKHRQDMLAHQQVLQAQILDAKARNTNVDMDSRERQLNQNLLNKITNNDDILTELQARLLHPPSSEPGTKSRSSTVF